MSEELVKKLYKNTATMDDVAEIKQHLNPTYHGMRGGVGLPFFISEIGIFKDESVGVVLMGNSIASYKGKIGNKMDFEMKYLNGILKNGTTRFEGSMISDNLIMGTVKFNNNPEDYYGFYIFPSVNMDLFKRYVKDNLN